MKIRIALTAISFATFAIAVLYSVYQHQNKVDLPIRSPGNSDWLSFRPQLLRQKGLIRYYDFEDERRSFGEFRNRGSHWLGDMRAADTQTPSEPSFQIREGHSEGTRAVQTDYYPIEARSYETSEKGFTVAAWIKHNGPGSVIGGNCPNAGTLLAMGDGVWSGWKFVLLHPSNVLVFELGRPKPESSVGTFSVTRIPPKTWTHIAATWDRQHINLYVNGLLCGRTEYSGPYSEIKPFNKLRVGYVGNGLGSVLITCDELSIFDHAKSHNEILTFATEGEDVPSSLNKSLLAMGEKFIRKQWQDSKSETENALRELSSHPRCYSTLLFRSAEILAASGNKEQAKKIFRDVVRNKDTYASLRSMAKFGEIYTEQPDSDDNLMVFPTQHKPNTIIYQDLLDTLPAYDSALIEFDFCLPL